MPLVFAENANRDIYIDPTTGDMAVLTDAEAVAQLCKSRIEAQRGEMKYAANTGMPTRATAWDTFNPQQFEAAARAIWLATTGVSAVTSFSMWRDGNTLYYVAQISTIYGTATVTNQ